MNDLPVLTLDDLHDRMAGAIARRLEATSAEEHTRGGEDLLLILDEFHRRGRRPYPASPHDGPAVSAPGDDWGSATAVRVHHAG